MAYSGWGTFFGALAGPLVRKVLAAVGIGVLTYSGLSVVQTQISSAVAAGWSGVGASSYQIIAMSGFVDAVSYWLSAVSAVVAYAAVGHLGRLTS